MSVAVTSALLLSLAVPSMARAEERRRPRLDRDEAARYELRTPGRAYFGVGVGGLGILGGGVQLRGGVFVSRHVAVEMGWITGGEAFSGGGPTWTADASMVLVGDTFFGRFGVGRHFIRATNDTFYTDVYESYGAMLGFGNRWDRTHFFISVEWLGLYIPTLAIHHLQGDDPGKTGAPALRPAPKSRDDLDLRFANVALGVAF